MMMKLACIGSVLLVFTTAGYATAAPLSYDEAVSGDIQNNTFQIDEGQNTIKGTALLSGFGGAIESDEDDFDLIVPINFRITSISLNILGARAFPNFPAATETTDLRVRLNAFGSVGFFRSEILTVIDDDVVFAPISTEDTVDLSEPLYRMSFSDSAPFRTRHDHYYDYLLTFQAERNEVDVPEPGTLGLFIALTAAFLSARRRTTKEN